MTGAFLTTLLFSLSVIFANRSIRALGAMRANLGRLTLAVIVLGLFAHTLGNGLHGAGLHWFLLSGVIGMGLGDLALYGALPRIGSRLSLLMTQCLAAPIAALAEWLWLDVTLSPAQLLAGLVILAGIALALMPAKRTVPATQSSAAPSNPSARNTAATTPLVATNATVASSPRASVASHTAITWLGLTFGLLSAAGQGLGAVMSRKANLAAALAGEPTGGLTLGITAAYQRILAGFAITVLWFSIQALLTRGRSAATQDVAPTRSRAGSGSSNSSSAEKEHAASPPVATSTTRTWRSYLWIPFNAFSGPILGVSCYQWALATTASGIVLPIVACTPLVIIPFSYWLEGERPTRRSILGAVIAVAGVVSLSTF
jgi:drug/metabolite transporter (DMT)-like permease